MRGGRLVSHFIEEDSELHAQISDQPGMLKYSSGVYILEACKQPKCGIVKNGMVNTQGFEEEGRAFQTQ
jgi:hypothetical protein